MPPIQFNLVPPVIQSMAQVEAVLLCDCIIVRAAVDEYVAPGRVRAGGGITHLPRAWPLVVVVPVAGSEPV